MELMTRPVRQSGMMTQRRVRGTVIAGLLCGGVVLGGLAGCGSVRASSTAGAPGAGGTGTTSATPAGGGTGPAVGCASVNQATKVTIRRAMHLVEPVRAGALVKTQSNPALVRTLFRDFCNAVGHPDQPARPVNCPADFGMSYTGTFFDGARTLATFVYGATGCQSLAVTANGKRQFTLLYASAAAAAPHLQADMAAALEVPKYAVSSPPTVNPGGPRKL
jgi:hypothetical protein